MTQPLAPVFRVTVRVDCLTGLGASLDGRAVRAACPVIRSTGRTVRLLLVVPESRIVRAVGPVVWEKGRCLILRDLRWF